MRFQSSSMDKITNSRITGGPVQVKKISTMEITPQAPTFPTLTFTFLEQQDEYYQDSLQHLED